MMTGLMKESSSVLILYNLDLDLHPENYSPICRLETYSYCHLDQHLDQHLLHDHLGNLLFLKKNEDKYVLSLSLNSNAGLFV